MKKLVYFVLLLVSTVVFSQSNAITYQAVIYMPGGQNAPGVNVTNVPMSNKNICLQFSFVDASNRLEYQEEVKVKTDEFGMVNITVGQGTQTGGYASNFSAITWTATAQKNLQVSLDATGLCSRFEELSNEPIASVPFANAAIVAGNVTGVVALVNGGTGATTAAGARANLGIENVDNTSDLNKPVSNATKIYVDTAITGATIVDADATTKGKLQLAGDLAGIASAPTVPGLALKENAANKSTTTTLGTSNVLFPTQNAVKTYVDTAIAGATIVDADATIKGKLQLAGDLAGTAAAPTVPGLALKENAANKSITTTLGTSNVLFPTQNAVKTYVDTAIAGATIVDADATTKGKLQLAGDLAGTAAAPTVPGLALKENIANKSTDIVADAASTTKYPSVKVIKDYVDSLNAAAGVADGSITSAKITDATIVNADVAANAQIDFNKLNIQKSNILGLGIVKGDLGLGNVDNTSDAAKPVSTATQAALALKANATDVTSALALKEDAANKSTTTTLGTSDVLFPTQNAVKTYVDTNITSVNNATTALQNTVNANATAANNAIAAVQTDVNTNETAANAAIALKEDAANKSTTTTLGTSDVLFPTQNAVKTYVDTNITSVNNATTALQNTVNANATAANNAIAAVQTDVNTNETAANAAIALKEDAANKSTTTILGTSDVLFPTQNAVKTYVDASVTTVNNTITTNATNTTTALALKEDAANKTLDLTTADGGSDVKFPSAKAVKTYADAKVADAITDAVTTSAPTQNAVFDALALKANATDVTSALALKEDAANKSTTTTLGTSDVLFPTQNAVKTYVDTSITTVNNTITTNATNTTTALALKEDAANKSTTTTLGTSDVLFPTQNAVKTYVDTSITTVNNTITTNATNTTTALALKEDAANKTLDLTTADGGSDVKFPSAKAVKTYADSKVVDGITDAVTTLAPSQNAVFDALALKENAANKTLSVTTDGASDVKFPSAKAVKTYVDASVISGAPDATRTLKGKIQLDGDLAGTNSSADSPVISNNAITTIKISNDAVTTDKIANGTIVDADLSATAAIADTKLATIATSGKVSNSATTATDANTASTIVARNSSGDFTAGMITASLTGNVSGNVSGTAANVTGVVAIANGGTGSATQNFVDLTTAQTIAGAKTFSDNTAVSGASTFTVGTGATALGGTLAVAGATTLNGNTSVSGSNTLTVGTGATALGGSLAVTGATTLNGNTSVSGSNTLTVGTGATTLGGTLGVTGASTLSSTLGVTGDVAVNTDKFKITASSGNTEIAGTLKIAGGSPSAGKVLTSDATGLGTWTAIPSTNLASAVTGILPGANGGTGVNNGTKTITLGGNLTTSGAHNTTITTTADSNVTLPTTGTLATLAGTETLANKTLTSPTMTTPTLGVASATSINGLTPTALATGFTIAGGTTSKTLTVSGDATVSGTNTGDQTTITGNAGTATKLATARKINTVDFDGSTDIMVTAAAETLTGTTLNSTVTTSSLTSVGTLTNLTVTNPIAGSITGNAATVTNGIYTTSKISALAETTSAELAGKISDETGSGTLVFATSPTLVTPTLGVATATSVKFTGSTSGTATLAAPAEAGTTTFTLPAASGTLALTSDITGGTATNFSGTLVGDVTGTQGATVVGKINGTSLAGLATGILKNTTSTGVPSIAVAADFPTLNQNTTGSAATLTTARAIYGNNFDGSASLTGIIASTYGGTGNGFTKFSGPTTSEKTFTLPDSNATLARIDDAQTFTGTQTFSSPIAGSITGNAATVTNGIYTTSKISDLAATTSAELAGKISDETGSGTLVFATSPTLVTPALGTPTAINLTNATALPLTAGAGVTGVLPVANGGTGSNSQNFVDLTTNQTIDGVKTFSGTSTVVNQNLTVNAAGTTGQGIILSDDGDIVDNNDGAATFRFTGGVRINNDKGSDGTITKITLANTGNITATGTIESAGIKLTGGSPAAGKVLTSDANGEGAWATLPVTNLESNVTGVLPIANGGTGSSTQNFVDLSTDQTVAGAKTFSGNTSVSGSSTFTVGTGATALGGTLGVTGDTTLSGTLAVTGATALSSTLNAGASTLTSASITNNAAVGGTLSVTGATTLSSTLGVTGNTTLSGTLGVTGATTLSSTLGVTGNTTLSGTLAVTGATTLSRTLGVTGDVAVNTSKFKITASSGNTEIAGTLKIAGGSPGAGKVLVSDDAAGLASWAYSSGTTSTKTAGYTILLSDKYVFYGSTATGAATFILPAATGNAGKEIIIKNKSAFQLTVQRDGTETIFQESSTNNNAATSITLGIEASNNWAKFVSDGVQWNVFRALF